MGYWRVVRFPEDAGDTEELWVRREDRPARQPWTCHTCLHTNNGHSRECEECGRDDPDAD
jgi:hypothetical protein